MKQYLFCLLAFAAANVNAETLNCTMTDLLDSSVFEESVSMEEYPDLSINIMLGSSCPVCYDIIEKVSSISIGANLYDGADSEVFEISSSPSHSRVYSVLGKDRSLIISLGQSVPGADGSIMTPALVSEQVGNENVTDVAAYMCKE